MQNLGRKIAELANEIAIRDSAIFLIWMTPFSLCRQTLFNLYQFGFLSSRSVFFNQRRTKANCARKASKMEFAF